MRYLLSLLFLTAWLACPAQSTKDIDEEDPYYLLSGQADKAIADGDYESAAARLLEAMSIRPDAPENVMLLSNLGMVYSYLDRDSLALATLTRALDKAPSMRTVLANRAHVLLKMGRDPEARADLDRLVAADSLNAQGRYLRGLLALAANDDSIASADFDVLEKLDPEGLATAIGKASLLTKHGRAAEALPYLRRMASLDPQPEHYAVLAETLLSLGNLSEAGETIKTGMEKYPDNADLYFCRAKLHRDLYELDRAREDAKKALRLGIPRDKIKELKL